MNNAVYSRLLALFQTVGLGGEAGDIRRGEVRAYAAAVSKAQEAAQKALSEVFTDTMGEDGLRLYCDLLNIEPGGTQEETKEKIISRLSKGPYIMGKNEFDSACANTPGYNISSDLEGEKITVNPVNKETLGGLSNLVNNYYPATYIPNITGSGITFNSFDALDYRWYELDALELPFYLWEKLGS